MLQVTALAQLFLVLCTVLINSIWIVKGGQNFDWKPDINGTNDYTCDLDFCTGNQFDVNRCCACNYIKTNISEFSPLHVEILNNKGESVVILNKKDTGAVNVSIKHSNGWLRFFPSNLCDFKSELKSIDFSYNQIKQWTNLSCLYMLDSLNLTRNSLATVSNSTFIGLYSLRSVDLSFNEIRTIDLYMLSDQSIHLFNIDLSNNLMKTLDASNMIVQDKFFCKIDFSYNEIRGITNTDETLLTNEVNQNGGDIFLQNMREEFYFNELFSYSFKTIEDYQSLFSNFRGTYDIKNSKAHCDCHVARFLKFCPDDFYRIYKAKNNKLVCGSPENLVNVSVIDIPLYNEVFDEMICEVWDHCPRKCKCIEQPRRDRLFIDCSNQSLHTLPVEMPQSLFNLEIDFSDNSIMNIDNREYLKRTVEINFERNLLKTVDKTFIENIPMMNSVNLKENQITTLAKEIQNLHPDIFLFNQTEVVCECSSEWIKIWRELKHANKSFEFGCRAENGHGVVIELFSFIDLFCETEKPDNSAIIIDNIADVNHTISRETFSDAYLLFGNESETNIVEKLNKGIRNLKRQDAQTLLIHISFGHFLNLTKAWLENERKEGRIKQSWSAWLKEKTGYSDDHARKLRALAKVLHEYHQFFNVGLPLNFILRKLKEIDIMLQIPELNAFWRRPVVLPTTNDLQSSQDDPMLYLET
ncbi:unnamed protein product [Mytilus edulis]|uniref:Uncharacterized protein n=1 Tax=Mytilus edulis TaxID=6550 RepID=A0A8S3QV18_MYTED|nr:unnamed protein product [Mytilus edulis]